MVDKWCVEEGYHYKISRKKLFATLREHGVTDGEKTGMDHVWSGIRWIDVAERMAAEQAAIGQGTLRGGLRCPTFPSGHQDTISGFPRRSLQRRVQRKASKKR
ncbi:MAG: hypothetical protein LUP97_01115 [Methanoregula sp.]|nr:hypothetical protein [Methanoregula sp.]